MEVGSTPQDSTSVTTPIVQQLDERRDSILVHRKRARECLQRQACKMLKLSAKKLPSVAAGCTVRLSIPDVDRARGSPRNVLAVILDVYTLGTILH